MEKKQSREVSDKDALDMLIRCFDGYFDACERKADSSAKKGCSTLVPRYDTFAKTSSKEINDQVDSIIEQIAARELEVYKELFINWNACICAGIEFVERRRKYITRASQERPDITTQLRRPVVNFLFKMTKYYAMGESRKLSRLERIEITTYMYLFFEKKIFSKEHQQLAQVESPFKSWPEDEKKRLKKDISEKLDQKKELFAKIRTNNGNGLETYNITGRRKVDPKNQALKDAIDLRTALGDINQDDGYRIKN